MDLFFTSVHLSPTLDEVPPLWTSY